PPGALARRAAAREQHGGRALGGGGDDHPRRDQPEAGACAPARAPTVSPPPPAVPLVPPVIFRPTGNLAGPFVARHPGPPSARPGAIPPRGVSWTPAGEVIGSVNLPRRGGVIRQH